MKRAKHCKEVNRTIISELQDDSRAIFDALKT